MSKTAIAATATLHGTIAAPTEFGGNKNFVLSLKFEDRSAQVNSFMSSYIGFGGMDRGLVVGVDLGATRVRAALGSLDREIIRRTKEEDCCKELFQGDGLKSDQIRGMLMIWYGSERDSGAYG